MVDETEVLHCYFWVLLPLWLKNHTASWPIAWSHHWESRGQAALLPVDQLMFFSSIFVDFLVNSKWTFDCTDLWVCHNWKQMFGKVGANLQAKELWSWMCFCGGSTGLFLHLCLHILGTDVLKTCHIWWHFLPKDLQRIHQMLWKEASFKHPQGFTGGKEWWEWQTETSRFRAEINPSDRVLVEFIISFIHVLS